MSATPEPMREAKTRALVELAKDTARLARIVEDGATPADAAAILEVDEQDLRAQFGHVIAKARANGRLKKLRTLQTQADRGVAEALIYTIQELRDGRSDRGTEA